MEEEEEEKREEGGGGGGGRGQGLEGSLAGGAVWSGKATICRGEMCVSTHSLPFGRCRLATAALAAGRRRGGGLSRKQWSRAEGRRLGCQVAERNALNESQKPPL